MELNVKFASNARPRRVKRFLGVYSPRIRAAMGFCRQLAGAKRLMMVIDTQRAYTEIKDALVVTRAGGQSSPTGHRENVVSFIHLSRGGYIVSYEKGDTGERKKETEREQETFTLPRVDCVVAAR